MKVFPSEDDKRNAITIFAFIFGLLLALCLFKFNIDVSDSIALFAAVIAISGLFWQISSNIKQSKMQTFLTYTQRYQDIVINLPIRVESSHYKLPHNKSEKENILRWLRAYFDLCSEQYYLHQKGLIDERVWGLWLGGMSDSLKKPAFQSAWNLIQVNDYYHKDFDNFITTLMR